MKSLPQLFRRLLVAAALVACAAPAPAAIDLVGHDTDLFTTNPNIPSQIPNVLIVLDNSSNWSAQDQHWETELTGVATCATTLGATKDKQGDMELCALHRVTANLDEQINVGLMMFNDQNKGGYVRYAMRPMNTTNKAALQAKLIAIATDGQGITDPREKTSTNANYDGPMNDALRYFNSFSTSTGVAGDRSANADTTAYETASKFKFLAGSKDSSCGYDYIIFIGNGFPNSLDLSPSIDNAAAAYADTPAVVPDTATLQATGVNTDVWAKFMYNYGVKIANGVYRHITTYTLDVCRAACQDNQATLLKSMASVSQGKYFRVTTLEGIEEALKKVFAEVQAVNSVFAATTLPVSINVRGTNLNQVYIGVFRPDPTLSPRWLGNLKHYKLGVTNTSTGQLSLVDQNDVLAVNLNTGFITNTATSIWTELTVPGPGFWNFRGSYPATDVGKDQDSPDGDLVEKGGAAQKIRQFYDFPDLDADRTRKIYTCTGTCAAGSDLKDYLFNIANADITAQKLGAFIGKSVTSIIASGTTATVTTAAAHGFVDNDTVVIAGATPSFYNGSFLIGNASGSTFTYTISTTVLNTTAIATYTTTTTPASGLVPGTDKVKVTASTPNNYDTAAAGAATAVVSGSSNQFSYTLTTGTTTASSGHAVTALRRLTSLVWSGGVATATTTGPHGYSAGNTVTIADATDSVFNGNFTITEVPSTTTFKFNQASTPTNPAPDTTSGVVALSGAIPTSWTNTPGSTLLICGVTSANYNTSTSNCTESNASATTRAWTACLSSSSCPSVTPNPGTTPLGNYFTYTTSASVSATASSLVGATIQNVVASDTSTFSISAATVPTTTVNQGSEWTITAIAAGNATVGTGTNVFLTLTAAKLSASGNSLRQLQANDTFTTTGTCRYRISPNSEQVCSGKTIAAVVGNSASLPGAATTSFQNMTTTVTVELAVNASLAGGGQAPSISGSPTMVYTGTNNVPNALRFTLSNAKFSGQALRTLAVNDVITFANCSYTASGGSTACAGPVAAVSGNSAVTQSTGVAAGTYDRYAGTVTVDIIPSNIASVTGGVSVSVVAAGGTVGTGSTTIAWTGKTFSSALTTATTPGIVAIDIGPQQVTATTSTGIFASKTGDLTSLLTSLSSQSRAAGTITAATNTSGDTLERDKLISWARGIDNKDAENGGADATDVRASVHGDVLHSRPAVVNYNRYGDDNDVFIFYGSNDGHLRAIKGGSLASGGGKEQWTFVAPEFFSKLKRQRDQSPTLSSTNPRDYFFDGPIAIYALDADKNNKIEQNTGDKVYLFVGMRRGGRMLYALDVTDPVNPKLLWKKGCTDATGNGNAAPNAVAGGGCDAGFERLGQTWSEPKLGYLRKWPTTLALMFGAGNDSPAEIPQPCYITAWDSSGVTYKTGVNPPTPMNTTNCPPSGSTTTTVNRTMGQGIYILNATTGAILWRAGPEASATKQVPEMTYAMPGDLAVMRNRANTSSRSPDIGTESVPTGYMDRIYASDTGGNVWRFDVADASGDAATAPAFVVSRLASISEAPVTGTHAALNYRKFMFNPDVVYGTDFDAVLIGSGDREHPFDMVARNRFYMFKDKNLGTLVSTDVNTVSGDPTVKWAAPTVGIITDTTGGTLLFDVTNNCIQNEAACSSGQTTASAKSDLALAKGWKLQLSTTGEKVIAPATTAAGTVIFNTNEPKDDTVTGVTTTCVSELGTARQYGLSYTDASATYIFGNLPTQYVPSGGRFAIFAGGGFLPQPVPVVVQIDGKYYQTVIAGVQTTNPGGLKLQTRVRTYWFRKVD
jgi:Tfp pilus tip-associated adhesin PilY1